MLLRKLWLTIPWNSCIIFLLESLLNCMSIMSWMYTILYVYSNTDWSRGCRSMSERALLTYYFCNPGKSHRSFGVCFSPGQSFWLAVCHDCDNNRIQILNTQETSNPLLKDTEHFTPKECSIPRETGFPLTLVTLQRCGTNQGLEWEATTS